MHRQSLLSFRLRPVPLVTLLPVLLAMALPWLAPDELVAQGPPPASVGVAPVELGPVELTEQLVASVRPVTRATLAAEQEGLVASRLFDEGQAIEEGAVLAQLDLDMLNVMRAAAAASQGSAKAELDRAKLDASNAERELQRVKRLFEGNVAPEKEYLDALTRYDQSVALVAVRKAQLAEADAALARVDLQIRKARIVSPISGVVSKRHVEVGNWLRVGDAVAELVQLDPLWVEVNAPEASVARLRRGDEARVVIDALGGKELTGKVDQILPEADAGSRTFRVRILLPNPEGRIRPGFFARATLLSSSDAPQLTVPKDAIVNRGGMSYVVAARNGVAAIVPVQVLRFAGERVAVVGELQPGEMVVTRGNELLAPGQVLIIPGLGGRPGAGGPPGAGGASGAGGRPGGSQGVPTTSEIGGRGNESRPTGLGGSEPGRGATTREMVH